MKYMNLSLTEIHSALIKGEVTPLELVKEAIELAKKDTNNAFEYICEKEALERVKTLDVSKKDSLLWGIPVVIKDNYSTKDIPTTGSSNILNGYVPIFSSEVVLRLEKEGAIVRYEYKQGKGNVVRSMFRDIDADCYIMVDGDDTYPAEAAVEMEKLVLEGKADMVIGDRLS